MAKEVMIKHYECEKCGAIHRSKYIADICCNSGTCRHCGTRIGWHEVVCKDCHEKIMFDKAVKMTYEEYGGNALIFNDKLFYDMEEVVDYCNDMGVKVPEYVWGTCKMRATICADIVIEQALDEIYEDAEFSDKGVKELREFLDKWNEKYGLDYYEDTNAVVFVPKEMLK